jgi:HK97 family phage prohead protease
MKRTKRTTPKREVRTFRNVEIRATDRQGPNGRPVVELRIVKPGVVDDYGSVWLPTTFDRALGERTAADPDDTPSLCWAHRWDDPIAHGIAYTPSADGPTMEFEYDDFEAVPRARQAHAQVASKTIRDCSVGFFAWSRREATKEDQEMWPGAREVITEADLDEVSLVLRGAVPGAKVLSQRSGAMVDVDAVVEIARRKVAGELTDEEAREAIELLGGEEGELEEEPPPAGGDDADEIAALEAEADELLAGRSVYH